MKPKLILTVGLPRSGKSTWAREVNNLYCISCGLNPIVNPDSIRTVMHGTAFRANMEPMVWAIAHIMVESLFTVGHTTVILDACNHTAQRRQQWLSKDWDCEYVEFHTAKQECEKRAIETKQKYLIPSIRRMAKEITWPNQ